MATDRRSSIHRLKAHMMGERSQQCKSQSSGNPDESGTLAHRAEGFREGLRNQEVLFLSAASLNIVHGAKQETAHVHEQISKQLFQ